jgi:hypothetical protein
MFIFSYFSKAAPPKKVEESHPDTGTKKISLADLYKLCYGRQDDDYVNGEVNVPVRGKLLQRVTVTLPPSENGKYDYTFPVISNPWAKTDDDTTCQLAISNIRFKGDITKSRFTSGYNMMEENLHPLVPKELRIGKDGPYPLVKWHHAALSLWGTGEVQISYDLYSLENPSDTYAWWVRLYQYMNYTCTGNLKLYFNHPTTRISAILPPDADNVVLVVNDREYDVPFEKSTDDIWVSDFGLLGYSVNLSRADSAYIRFDTFTEFECTVFTESLQKIKTMGGMCALLYSK